MDFDTFWSTIVYPDSPCTFNIPEVDCSITNIAAENSSDEITGRSVLYASVNSSEPIAIAALTAGKVESAMIHVSFCPGDNVVLTIKGTIPMHVSGYLYGAMELKIDNGHKEDEK